MCNAVQLEQNVHRFKYFTPKVFINVEKKRKKSI